MKKRGLLIIAIVLILGIVFWINTEPFNPQAVLDNCELITTCSNETVSNCVDVATEVCTQNCSECSNDSEICSPTCVTNCENVTSKDCTDTVTEICITEEICEEVPTTTLEEIEEPEKDVSFGPIVITPTETKNIEGVGVSFKTGESIGQKDKVVGEKIEDDPDYETFFVEVGTNDSDFQVIFYHNFNDSLDAWIEGNVSYQLSDSTPSYLENTTLAINLEKNIIPRFQLHVGKTSEIFKFGKVIPQVNVQGGSFNLLDRDDGKLDLTIQKDNQSIEILGIADQNLINAKFSVSDNNILTTSIAKIDSIEIESATLTLDKFDQVNSILECEDIYFNSSENSCSNWIITNLSFTEDEDSISFTVDHFTSYAGGNISANETGYLIIWDENDLEMPNASKNKVINDDITFFADYKQASNGTKITDADCTIQYGSDPSFKMTYNESYSFYIYNRTFTSSGLYNFTVSCQASGFESNNVTDLIPVSETVTKQGAISTITGAVPFYTEDINPQVCSVQRAGDVCTTTWQVNSTGVLNTSHTFFAVYNLTSNTENVESNLSSTFEVNITANDTQSPIIIDTVLSNTILTTNDELNFFMTAADNLQVSTCWSNITQPNTTINEFQDLCSGQQSFSPGISGIFNISFAVNDTDANFASSNKTFTVTDPISFSFEINSSQGPEESFVNIIFPDTGESVYQNISNETIDLDLPEGLFNIDTRAFTNRLQATFKDINFSLESNETIGLDHLETPIEGYVATYAVESTYSFSNVTIKIFYDDVTLTDESNLKFYQCSDWNLQAQTCGGSWTDITDSSTQDSDNNFFETVVTSLSGFSIEQVTTEEPSAPPSGGSSSTGGSGASSSSFIPIDDIIDEVLKQFGPTRLVPEGLNFDETLEPGETIERIITLRNTNDFTKEIIITIPDKIKRFVRVSKEKITLEPGDSEDVIVWFNIPDDTSIQLISGGIIISSGVDSEQVPILLQLKEGSRILELRTIPIEQVINQGNEIKLQTTLVNRGGPSDRINFLITVTNTQTNEIVSKISKEYSVKDRLEIIERIAPWENQQVGEYTIEVVASFVDNPDINAASLNLIVIKQGAFSKKVLGIDIKYLIIGLSILLVGLITKAILKPSKRKKRKKKHKKLFQLEIK